MKVKFNKVLVVAVGVCLATGGIYLLKSGSGSRHVEIEPPSSASQDIASGVLFQLGGFDYTAYEGDRRAFRIKADHFEISKRKFGPFYVSPLKEASASGVELHIYQDGQQTEEDGRPDISWGDVLEVLPDEIKNQGVITRFRVQGLKANIYRDGEIVSSVSSESAVIDPKRRLALFEGRFSVKAGESVLVSEAGEWDQGARLFRVPGPYMLMTAAGMNRGSGLQFDAELNF